MREIIFRGKSSETREWIYGSLIKRTIGSFIVDENNKCSLQCCGEFDFSFNSKLVKSESIGQYTGLTDKNGKRIFEGDIFKFNDEVWESYYTSCGTEYNSWEVENYGVVGFYEYSGRFDFIEYKFNENSVEADLHENNAIDFAEFVSELEVIGNIHDNPEFLKEGAEE